MAKVTIENYKEFEVRRGLYYSADISLNGKKIGSLENPGDGSYTRIVLTSDKETFDQEMEKHFKTLGWDTTGRTEHSLYYTFAGHLIDIHEEGEVDEISLEMGFVR